MSCTSTDCDLAFCYCRVRNAFPVAVIRPTDLRVEIRRGANAIAPCATGNICIQLNNTLRSK